VGSAWFIGLDLPFFLFAFVVAIKQSLVEVGDHCWERSRSSLLSSNLSFITIAYRVVVARYLYWLLL